MAYVLNFHPISCLTESEFRSAGIKEGGRKREGGGGCAKAENQRKPSAQGKTNHTGRRVRIRTQATIVGGERRPHCIIPALHILFDFDRLLVCLVVYLHVCLFVCLFF